MTQNGSRKYRRAADVARSVDAKRPQPLFDAFWLDGELALLFGEAGSWKSILAVQLADALARGRPIAELQMPAGAKERRKVLYVDLVLSDRQFSMRYGRFRFAANLYRERPPAGEDIAAWVRSCVENDGFTAVVLDDLSMVSQTNDGTRETLRLIRELREITVETGVPMLVLADSLPFVHGREVSERDLRRSSVLCSVADSVFAIGAGVDGPADERVIVQTRSRSGELVWTHERPFIGTLDKLENGLLGLELEPKVDEEREDRIREVKRLHDDEKKSFREIADELEISKSTAQRLYSEWHEGLRDPYFERKTLDGNPPAYWEPDLNRWISEEEYHSGVLDHRDDLGRQTDAARERNTRQHLEKMKQSEERRSLDDGFDEEDPLDAAILDAEEREYLREVGMLQDGGNELQRPDREGGNEQVCESIAWDGSETQPLAEPSGPGAASRSRLDESPSNEVSTLAHARASATLPEAEVGSRVDVSSCDEVSSLAYARASATWITDLERTRDADGNEIFVEKWLEHTAKPKIWYKRNKAGFSKFTRGTWGVNVKKIRSDSVALEV